MYKKKGILLATMSLALMSMALAGCNGTTTTTATSTVTPPPSTTSTAPTTYTIGGTATGFLASTQLTLQDNGGDDLVLTQSGAFSFTTPLSSGSAYNVTIKTQPTDGTLFGVTYGSGTVGSSNISTVTVSPIVETVLHSFTGTTTTPADGGTPQYGSLVQGTDGNFYGMTYQGGTNNAGTVFQITPAGVETVLHSFANNSTDGGQPQGSLVQGTDGNFYGMTASGGASSSGTVFKITSAGVETVLHSFANNGTDGTTPYGSLVQGTDGNFYGMTSFGGPGLGTVFKITPAGVETVLYSFSGNPDGAHPHGDLVQGADGNFYGMTLNGGANNTGTVFKITPTGAETVLYSFNGGSPYGSLVQGTDGNFYGMTSGEVFKITPAGIKTTLHSFSGGTDGDTPYGSLVQGTDGNFYGMTSGGLFNNAGNVFQITPAGVETVLHSFPNNSTDGNTPYGSLVQGTDGNFYGMTTQGGADNLGIVFKIN